MASKSLCIFLSLLFLVARVLAAPNDEEDVRKTVGGFSQSWNRHDMEAFGKLFATEADFVNVAGDRWKGREAIQAQHACSHSSGMVLGLDMHWHWNLDVSPIQDGSLKNA